MPNSFGPPSMGAVGVDFYNRSPPTNLDDFFEFYKGGVSFSIPKIICRVFFYVFLGGFFGKKCQIISKIRPLIILL